jgi:hypothetical protein
MTRSCGVAALRSVGSTRLLRPLHAIGCFPVRGLSEFSRVTERSPSASRGPPPRTCMRGKGPLTQARARETRGRASLTRRWQSNAAGASATSSARCVTGIPQCISTGLRDLCGMSVRHSLGPTPAPLRTTDHLFSLSRKSGAAATRKASSSRSVGRTTCAVIAHNPLSARRSTGRRGKRGRGVSVAGAEGAAPSAP